MNEQITFHFHVGQYVRIANYQKIQEPASVERLRREAVLSLSGGSKPNQSGYKLEMRLSNN